MKRKSKISRSLDIKPKPFKDTQSIDIMYSDIQEDVFFNCCAKRKVITKGRRVGFTKGCANYVIEELLKGESPLLWIDTIHGNIDRYIERYFYPVLKGVDKSRWKWKPKNKELVINGHICDFRSADRPENIEGFGYKKIIVNEAGIVLKNKYLWYNAILPMAIDYGAEIIVGGTPKGKKSKGEEHIFYTLYKKCIPFNEWKKLPEEDRKTHKNVSFKFSTYDNPFVSEEEIEEIVSEVSSTVAAQEIYGDFTDSDEYKVFKRCWWRKYSFLPDNGLGYYLQSWDTAFKEKTKNDFSACSTWYITYNGMYLVDLWKDRLLFPDLCDKAKQLYEDYKPSYVLIEDKASGQSLIQTLRSTTMIPIIAVQVDSDKITRANASTPYVETGKVFLPENKKFTEEFIDSAEDFPNVEFDDDIDCVVQAINYVRNKSIIPNMKTSNVQTMKKAYSGF
jgi:predicted phage terminase large subunit-like protein